MHDNHLTLRSCASDRKLYSCDSTESSGYVSDERSDEQSDEQQEVQNHPQQHARLAIQIDVMAGPCSDIKVSIGSEQDVIPLGRAPSNLLVCHDAEVSGKHAVIEWNHQYGCWTVSDLGSLNGTFLNGEGISQGHKVRGDVFRLSSDDMIQLGSGTRLKVSIMPEEMAVAESQDRRHSLSMESFPRSLTISKSKVPSYTSLVSPKVSHWQSNVIEEKVSDELRLECCVMSCTGRDHFRKKQDIEDVSVVTLPLIDDARLYAALLCVFDGHCGKSAAEAASVALPEEITMRIKETLSRRDLEGENIETRSMMDSALHDAFLATDDRIADEAGCTATSILVWKNPSEDIVQIQGSNVGDSMAILIDVENRSKVNLSEDHRLTNPKERARLEENGIPLGEDTRRLYGLNLARALGDRFLKDEDLGLSAEPFVSNVHAIDPDHGALVVVASDGVWDVLSLDDAAELALKADVDSDKSVIHIAGSLVQEAQDLGSRDDVTVLVARISPRRDCE
jgi:protein phosphatase